MTIFTKIINGEIPCYKVAENDCFFAFLDIAPMTKGHTLVIPKFEADKEGDYIFDMDDDMYAGLMMFSKQVAKAIDVNPYTVSLWEKGKRKPNLKNFVKIARFYNIKLFKLLSQSI